MRRGHRVSLDLSDREHAELLRVVERSGQRTMARWLRMAIARAAVSEPKLDAETLAERLRAIAEQVEGMATS